MLKSHTAVLSAFFIVASVATAFAQAKLPSPPAETSVTIDGKKISIAYSAPSMRGRKIFGGLVPYDKWWRTGANSATKFTTEADLEFDGGLKVPAGNYTLYSILTADSWTLIVNKQTGQWGTQYDEAQDLGRVKMTVKKTDAPVETFSIKLAGSGGQGTITMAWENTEGTASFHVSH
jgi:hypothetical protein